MNRATLPTNALAAEVDFLSDLLVESVSRSLRARCLTTSWQLNDCQKAKDIERNQDRKEVLFSCNISTEKADQFLATVRNKAPKAFRQALQEEEAASMHVLTKLVAEVLADERHFIHISRVFSAVYVSTAVNLHACVFRTNDTLSSDVLLIRFDFRHARKDKETESEVTVHEKSANTSLPGATKGRMLSRFFRK